jgi:uncharacterized protein (DUF39 family)
MNTDFIRGVSVTGYGTSLMVGIGIPIPILNEDLAYFTGMTDKDIKAPVVDYGTDYPEGENRIIQHVTYQELKSGTVKIQGRSVPTAPLSSYPVAKKIANELKKWIEQGFTLGEPQIPLPTVEYKKRK